MPDQAPPSFEHAALEADMKRLAAEVQRHRERPELKGASDREILKQAIQSLPPTTQPKDDAAAPSAGPLPNYAKNAPAEAKLEIEYLLDLAFHHGIARANSKARKSSPFILDAFHDALVGKLYPELQKRGLLK
jgi:hypothetical protein